MNAAKRPMLVNVERLHRFMDEAGCAAVVARSGKNFTYLAGIAYPGTLARHLDFPDTPRDVFCIWPRSGEPIVVTHHAGRPVTERDSWVERIEVIEDYVESGIEGAARVLRSLGLDAERIGFEKTYVSAARWSEIERELPRADLFDCTELMDTVRWVKTPGEVELLRRAADIQDDAHLEVFSGLREGDTEREIHARMIAACIERGCGFVHGILNSSSNPDMYSGEGDHPFRKGDVIRTDYVSYLDGYPGHQSRLFSLGPPSAETRDRYRVYRDIYRALADYCRPGRKSNEVWQFAHAKLTGAGFVHPPGVDGGTQRRPLVPPAGPRPAAGGGASSRRGHGDCARALLGLLAPPGHVPHWCPRQRAAFGEVRHERAVRDLTSWFGRPAVGPTDGSAGRRIGA